MAITTAAAARDWLLTLPGVSRETLERLDQFAALLRAESAQQNLVAASTLGDDALWTRHFLDSAQLLPLAHSSGRPAGSWLRPLPAPATCCYWPRVKPAYGAAGCSRSKNLLIKI